MKNTCKRLAEKNERGNYVWMVKDERDIVIGGIEALRTSASVKTTSYNQAVSRSGETRNFESIHQATDWLVAEWARVCAEVMAPDYDPMPAEQIAPELLVGDFSA